MPSENLMFTLEEAEALLADGFDEALIGCTTPNCRAVYDAKKMVNILIERDGMSREDALEYLEFNTFCAYVGEMTPVYVWPDEED